MKTFNEIVAEVATKEGKTLQEHIGNVRESMSILSDMIYEDLSIIVTLFENGKRRAEENKG